jgi:hypothetical protein
VGADTIQLDQVSSSPFGFPRDGHPRGVAQETCDRVAQNFLPSPEVYSVWSMPLPRVVPDSPRSCACATTGTQNRPLMTWPSQRTACVAPRTWPPPRPAPVLLAHPPELRLQGDMPCICMNPKMSQKSMIFVVVVVCESKRICCTEDS